MLQEIKPSKVRARGGRFVLVASRYNARYVAAMLRAAQGILRKAGAEEIRVIRVPGAFEIPVVVSKVASSTPPPSAVIALGVILRGATAHAQTVSDVVSEGLGAVAIETGVPVIHEVLLLEDEQQARERCLGRKHNRGAEAASTALEMSRLMAALERG